jgi:hypothetical protein
MTSTFHLVAHIILGVALCWHFYRRGKYRGHVEARTALVLEQIRFMHQLAEKLRRRAPNDKRAVN